MEVTLAGIALGIGVLGALLSYLVPLLSAPPPRPEERSRISPTFWVALAAVIILFLATLPKGFPFSPGQRLGWGFLIGGLIALLAVLAASRLGPLRQQAAEARPRQGYWPYPSVLVQSLALAGAAAVFLVFRGDPVDALLGSALGTAVVAGVVSIGAPKAPRLAQGDSGALQAGAALSAALAAACSLGVYHFPHLSQRGWWAFPLALAGFWLLGQCGLYLAVTHRPWARHPVRLLILSAGLSALVAVLFGEVLSGRLEPARSVIMLLVSGAVTAAIVLWLTLSAEQEELSLSLCLSGSGLAALLTVVLLVFSFRLLAGFGVAIALLAAWPLASSALGLGGWSSRLLVRLLMVGASLLLLQVFLERAAVSVGEAELSFHYTLVGAALGAMLPIVFSGFRLRPGVGRVLLLGALGALSPILVLTLWGPDAVLGLLVGLVASQVIAAILASVGDAACEGQPALGGAAETYALWQAPTGLLALGMALVAAQFSRGFAFLYQMPRLDKAYLAGAIGLLVLFWAIGMGLAALRRQPLPAPPAGGQEG
jgi:hypothetical protein